MIKQISLTLIIVLFSLISIAQPTRVFNVDFNNMDEIDNIAGRVGVIAGNPGYECGVDGMAIRFDGLTDSIAYEGNIERLLNQDFALSFYFFIDNTSNTTDQIDLISFGNNECPKDSSLTVRYIPQTSTILTEISINGSATFIFPVRGQVPPGQCWNYVVINKSDDKLELFINDVLVDENEDFARDFRFKIGGVLTIGGSPCINSFTTRFAGLIDEIRIYDQVLEETEVVSENLNPDRIITEDQTIFIGETIDIVTGNSCSSSFSWDPETTLDDPTSMSPTASPTETTTYNYTVNYGICSTTDNVRISVVDPTVSSCDQLLVPNAFTPNGDSRNDEFGISNDFIIDDLITFQVFSKWGEKLFETTSLDQKWDGTYKGKTINPGSFLYRVVYICSGEEFSASGNFILIN
jgi:gliding motility-associated-like protein